jgi:hypothetical protein
MGRGERACSEDAETQVRVSEFPPPASLRSATSPAKAGEETVRVTPTLITRHSLRGKAREAYVGAAR